MITIGQPKISKQKKRARLYCDIEMNDETKTLWLEVEDKYAGYLVKDRCDAFLIAMLPIAMRNHKDIQCLYPVSEELLHNIKIQLIPALAKSGEGFYKTRIIADVEKHPVKSAGAIGTGFSRGVNSMHVIESYVNSEYPRFDITHLCINDVGAFDIDGYKNYNKDVEEIKKECFDKSICLADELEIPYVFSKSNLAKDFPSEYAYDHVYCNLFPVFALQKLFKMYYYGSSGLDLEHISMKHSDKVNCSNYDVILNSILSTSNLKIVTEGCEKNRLEKTADIIHFSPAQSYLHVCLTDSKNCNKCIKCMRTMLALDGLDRLDYFSQVFDVDYYKKHKKTYISYLEKCHARKDMMNEPTYQLFKDKKMLPDSEPDILDENIVFDKPINTSSLIVKNHTTGKILMKKQSRDFFSTVGVAKIMMAIIALESGKTQMAISIPENLIPGVQIVTIFDLINILMISQSNSVADLIAENVCDTKEEFINLMNQKAKQLKAFNTYYVSLTGLDAESYTTAEDVLTLLEYCFKNQHFCKIFKSKSYIVMSSGAEKRIPTQNPLFLPQNPYYVPECIATKYGIMGVFANSIVVAQKGEDVYLAILMGIKEEGKTLNRFKDASNIIKAVLK